jgi:hypothetical protein
MAYINGAVKTTARIPSTLSILLIVVLRCGLCLYKTVDFACLLVVSRIIPQDSYGVEK